MGAGRGQEFPVLLLPEQFLKRTRLGQIEHVPVKAGLEVLAAGEDLVAQRVEGPYCRPPTFPIVEPAAGGRRPLSAVWRIGSR
jgi:hypothetical protein